MENIQYRIVTRSGEKIDVNVDNAGDLFDAAPEIKESILAGDIKSDGIPIHVEDVLAIEDTAG